MISIVLPAYNERDNLLALIPSIEAQLGSLEHEIIVVDDNSADGTLGALNAMHWPGVHILTREEKGLGSAIGFGIAQSSGDILIIMDSDGNHQPQYLVPLLDSLEDHGCVCGSRFLKGGGMDGRIHFALSRWFNHFVKWATGGSLTDYSYGFVAMHRRLLNHLTPDYIFRGHGDYCIRLLHYIEKAGYRVGEIPMVNGRRLTGTPNRAYARNFFRYFREVVKLAVEKQVRFAR